MSFGLYESIILSRVSYLPKTTTVEWATTQEVYKFQIVGSSSFSTSTQGLVLPTPTSSEYIITGDNFILKTTSL